MSTKAIRPILTNPLIPPEKVEFTIPGEMPAPRAATRRR